MNPAIANEVKQQAAQWCEGFAKALDGSLQAVVLYGGLAKDEFVPEQSDVNVLIVLRTATHCSPCGQTATCSRAGACRFASET